MKRLIVLLPILLISAITTAQGDKHYHKTRSQKQLGAPTESEALVYVFRLRDYPFGFVRIWGFADDQLLGVSRKYGYYFGLVPGGKHVIWTTRDMDQWAYDIYPAPSLEVELLPGQTYYFETAIGRKKGGVPLVQIDAELAQKYLRKCAYTEPTELGRLRGAVIARGRKPAVVSSAEPRDRAR
jgi:hypothetical protein